MDAFLEVFDRVVEARRAHGFEIEGVWYSRESGRFVWVVGFEGDVSFEDAVTRYYDSDMRKAISPNPLDFLDEVELTMVERHI